MSKALIILLGLVAAVFIIGIVNAYGEEVGVELDTNKYNPETQLCNEGLSTGEWWCNWKPYPSGYTGEQFTVESGDIPMMWSEEEKKYIPTEEFEEESKQYCYDSLDCPVGNYQFSNGTIVNFEEIIAESQVTPAELPDENVFRCGYDIALYQDGSQFDVPVEIWIDKDGNKHVRIVTDTALKTDNFTSKEELAAQACFAQWALEIREHVDVITKVSNADDYFIYHADVAYGIPPITQALVNADAPMNKDRPANLSIHNIICNGAYSYFYQVLEGCEVPEMVIGREAPTIENSFPDWMKADIDQYNKDDGVTMAKKILKDHNTDKLLAQQKQLRD